MRRVDAEAQEHPAALIIGAVVGIVLGDGRVPGLGTRGIGRLHGRSPPSRDVGAADEGGEGNVKIVREGDEDES